MQPGGGDPLVEKFVHFCESDFGRRVMNVEAAYLRVALKECKTVLDIGCGIGSIEERLRDLELTGLDSSEAMLAEARKRSGKTFVSGVATKLPFPDASFDAVFMITTLEFLTDYKKAIDEASRVLVSGGKLIVLMLNPQSAYFKEHYSKEGDYFKTIKHMEYSSIVDYASKLFELHTEYFLGINQGDVFESNDAHTAAIFVINGVHRS